MQTKGRNSLRVLKSDFAEMHKKIFEEAMDAIYIADTETGAIIECNRAACKLAGRKRDELIGMFQSELHPPGENGYELSTACREHLSAKDSHVLETRILTKKGAIRDVAIKTNLFEVEGRSYIQGMFRDITDYKQAEEALCRAHDELEERVREKTAKLEEANVELRKEISERKQEQEKLRKLSLAVEQSPVSIVITDKEGNIEYVNPMFSKTSGYTAAEAVGKNAHISQSGGRLQEKYKKIWATITSGKDWRGEFHSRKKNGEMFWENVLASPIVNEEGEITNFLAVKEDITEQKRIEEELIKSKSEFAYAMDFFEDAIYLVDMEDKVLSANRAFCDLTGLTPEQTIGRDIASIIHPGGEAIPCPICKARKSLKDAYITLEADHPDNSTGYPIEVMVKIIRNVGNEPTGVMVGIRNLSRQRKALEAEEALRTSEERYALAMRTANDGFWDRNLKTGETYFSPRWKEMLGYRDEEICDRKEEWENRIHPDDHDRVLQDMENYFKGHAPYYLSEYRLRRRDGSYCWVMAKGAIIQDEDGNPACFAGSHTDITERKRAEEEKKTLEAQLRHMQKMESIGTLAGGIAHDFNNILTPIMNYTSLLMGDLPEDGSAHEYLEQIMKAADRAKELVRQILILSSQGEEERRHVHVHLIMKEVIKLIRPLLPATIEIRQKIDTDCGAVLADPSQIHQVMMNLFTNAFHAMRDEGGVLEVSAKVVQVDAKFAKEYLNLQPGKYVRTTVSDSGHGMDDFTIQRIFDPFFSTKEVGEGTGLGLSVVHGIILKHRGEITVQSEPGRGTTFNIYLPSAKTTAGREAPGEKGAIPQGTESILFVDDEKEIAFLGETMLKRHGYKVTTKYGSLEALNEFRTNPQKYDLVISDYTMPKMTGIQLARELIEIRRDIPVILTSGYNDKVTLDNFQEFGISEYLMKPFTIHKLCNSVRSVLDKAGKINGTK